MRQQMTIGKKLVLITGALIAATVIVGTVAIYNLAGLNKITQNIITDPMPGMDKMAVVRTAFATVQGDAWRHVASSDSSVKAEMERDVQEQERTAEKELQAYESTIATADDREIFNKLRPAVQEYLSRLPEVFTLSRAGQSEKANAKLAESLPALKSAEGLLQAEIELNRANGQKLATESQATYGNTFWLVSVLLAACSLGGVAVAFVVIRGLNVVLRQTAGELAAGAQQVSSAAAQISGASQSLAQGSSEQAASLEETSASSEEINSMARKNSEHSKDAAMLMTQSQQKFVDTNRSLDQMVVAMGEINTSSDKISRIIKVIDEIAFQTNILALNAAVEAARAGEAGMGFAVVADEVRNLAQRCAQAAKDTSALIEESIAKSNDGKVKVDQVAAAIRTITEESGKVKTLVDEVSVGSEEQSHGIDQIAKAIAQMEQVTQRTAANSEESAAAAQELNAQAETLQEIVRRLAALVGSDA